MNKCSNAADLIAENISQETYNDLADILFDIFLRHDKQQEKVNDTATA